MIPPPSKFNPARPIAWARLCQKPSFIREKKRRGRKRRGQLYEKKVIAHLDEILPLPVLPGPWIEFQERDAERTRFCQPDGLIFDPWEGICILLEIKYQHTADAWWQLYHLYRPVVEYLFPLYAVRLVEVVKWYDPLTPFPERPALLRNVLQASEERIGVHICTP